MRNAEIRRYLLFYGNVQGVGFRYRACYSARNLGMTGWARNLDDGSVEMEVEGFPRYIDAILYRQISRAERKNV